MIPTYNPTEHLREALDAVLTAQRMLGEEMQIEVVDDASPSVDVAALVAAWDLSGIAVFRRESNGGLAACWNTCVERARGSLVHLLHQDDLVSPHFYSHMTGVSERFPRAGMLFSRNVFLVGEEGHLGDEEQAVTGPIDHWLERICTRQRVQCPAVVVRRSIYERIGGFDPTLHWVIDWEMWIRVALSTEVVYVNEPLATYRIHPEMESSRLKNAGLIVADLARGLVRVREALLRAGRGDCIALATDYVWRVSGDVAWEAHSRGRPDIARREVGASLRHFGARVALWPLLQRLRWYARLWFQSALRGRPA